MVLNWDDIGWPDDGAGGDNPASIVTPPTSGGGGSGGDQGAVPPPLGESGINDAGTQTGVPVPLTTPPASSTPSAPEPIIGPSGYDYTNWTWELGQRPPSNQDWQAMTPEQRKRILGNTSIEDAREAWQENFKPGGVLFKGPPTGAGGGVAAGKAPPIPGGDWLSKAWDAAWARYNGGGPYDQAALDRIKAQAKAASVGAAGGTKEILGRDLIRRGLSRSAYGADKAADVDVKAGTDYSQNVTSSLVRAVEANYAAKTQALQQAIQVLQQQQQAQLAAARNQLDRDIANANVALGYARIQAESQNLQSSLSSAYELAQLNNNEALIRLALQLGLNNSDLDSILKDQYGGR